LEHGWLPSNHWHLNWTFLHLSGGALLLATQDTFYISSSNPKLKNVPVQYLVTASYR